jgi:DNA mismatch repair protein MutS
MAKQTTPMMEQYRSIRRSLGPGTILFFRLGDFYEMFFEDAQVASEILDITLTKRQGTPMCGIPYHAANQYLSKLIRAGQKVAIAEQVEEPGATKGIVKREVTSVITPGTVIEESALDSNRNNYLAALTYDRGVFGMSLLDLSTGSFWVEEIEQVATLQNNLVRYAPTECILPESLYSDPEFQQIFMTGTPCLLSPHEDWTFEHDNAHDTLLRHFKLHSLEGFGCEQAKLGVCAAGAMLHYVNWELRRDISHVRRLQIKNPADYLLLDEATTSNLELVTSLNTNRQQNKATLLAVLDTAKTAMGGRLLRDWIVRPLHNLTAINQRLDAVETFTRDRLLLNETREFLRTVRDIERLISRLGSGSSNARDVLAVAQSLETFPELKKVISGADCPFLQELNSAIQPLPELLELIRNAIDDEPPISLKEGGVMRTGYNAELDELRILATQGKQWLAEFQQREAEKTGIKTLKVRHNRVFGYYIEISLANAALVPDHYIRKQTLVNAERYITPELKEYEDKIFGAQERAVALETELFTRIREAVLKEMESLQASAAAVATVDVLATFAERALTQHYVRPLMTEADELHIKNGRHPVIEQMPGTDRFVPNDTLLNCSSDQLNIITGPNMAGKSTYIRQVALITIMAHMGCFVPASEATVALTDRVFTRVGASDDLARGRSTFMVEMQETANILNNATPNSLIVLDEIGRGTSTFDGISIAWAVAEFLCQQQEVKAKTLFATHYHELTDLALTIPGVKNYNVLVREHNDTITFLRKVGAGGADKSYGIQVARLAGLPSAVIGRAKEILSNLEEGEFGDTGQPKIAKHKYRKKQKNEDQLTLL